QPQQRGSCLKQDGSSSSKAVAVSYLHSSRGGAGPAFVFRDKSGRPAYIVVIQSPLMPLSPLAPVESSRRPPKNFTLLETCSTHVKKWPPTHGRRRGPQRCRIAPSVARCARYFSSWFTACVNCSTICSTGMVPRRNGSQ